MLRTDCIFTKEPNLDVLKEVALLSHNDLQIFHKKSAEHGVSEFIEKLSNSYDGTISSNLHINQTSYVSLLSVVDEQVDIILNAMCFPFLFLLVDTNGKLIHFRGSENVLSNLEMRNIKVGSSFSLQTAGTNAISVSMHLEAPVFLNGDNHFLNFLKQWSCLCIPIYKDDEIYAYLDMSVFRNYTILDIYPILRALVNNIERKLNIKSEKIDLKKKIAEYNLTKRQQELAKFWIEGENYKEIAKKLQISDKTVRTTIVEIYRRLKVNSKEEMMLLVLNR